jgi:ribonuclease R
MKREKNLKTVSKEIERFFAANSKKAFNYKQICAALNIESTEGKNYIIRTLKQMEKDGMIDEVMPGKYLALLTTHFITGKLEVTQRGAGFVIPEDGSEIKDDIYIGSENLNTGLHGDTVKVNLFAKRSGSRVEGEVIEVLKRKREEFVGVVELGHNYAFISPDDKRVQIDIFIPEGKINNAKNGEKVRARVVDWSNEHKNPIGEIIEILGKPGDHNTEMHAIIAEYGFANKFPNEVEKDADKISDLITKDEIAKRRDFRKITTFTIDPEDAKDFDDALSIEEVEDGIYEIGVHIADVSHYVTPNTVLDAEAFERATSVYLVDRTIPMLPEKLSNGVCSLRPHEEKLTFSAVFKMTLDGEILDKWIGKTVIYSDRRFAYEEAQDRIESKVGDFAKEINTLNNIALILRKARFKNGAVNFETEEVKFKLDENYKPIGIYKKVRKDAHKMIEEFMLLANRTVAEFVHKMKGEKQPKTFVYRVHEPPSEEKLKLFNLFAARFGLSIQTTSQKSISTSFNNLLNDVEGKPEQNIVQNMAVRSMMKAYYSTKKTSHYGLAFDYYTHFTSPIRRYPDLMAHRLLFSYLNNGKSANELEYEEKCKHSSQMEIQAADAERASVKYKQVEYIKQFIGEQFNGLISGVTEWGIYVEITEYKCEGLVRLANLTDDFYDYDEFNQWIIGRRTRKIFQLGGEIKVIVKQADLQKRQIDLDVAEVSAPRRINHKIDKNARKDEKRKKRRR